MSPRHSGSRVITESSGSRCPGFQKDLAEEQLDKTRKKLTVLAFEAEVEKKRIYELLDQVREAEARYNEKVASFLATKMDVGVWRKLISSNGKSKSFHSSEIMITMITNVSRVCLQ